MNQPRKKLQPTADKMRLTMQAQQIVIRGQRDQIKELEVANRILSAALAKKRLPLIRKLAGYFRNLRYRWIDKQESRQ